MHAVFRHVFNVKRAACSGYIAVDVEYLYKISGNIFLMTSTSQSIANEHTLLNRKHICDASELLSTREFTQLG